METPQKIIQTTKEYNFRGIKTLLTYPQYNNGSIDELIKFFKVIFNDRIEYIVVCKEDHKKTDEKHYHVYIKLNTKATISVNNLTYREIRPNLKRVLRTPNKVVAYVKKDKNYKKEGTCTNVPKLTLQKKYKLIKDKTYNELFKMATLNLNEICRVKQIKKDLIENTWPMNGSKERKVYWFFGETGTDKTREATKMIIDLYEEDWVSLTEDLRTFFNPYNGEKGVIFDNIRKGSIVWNTLLTITDRYRTSVNIKSNKIPWLTKTIIFTSPQPFTKIFTTEKNDERAAKWDKLEQFTRKVYELREFK